MGKGKSEKIKLNKVEIEGQSQQSEEKSQGKVEKVIKQKIESDAH